MHVLKSAHHKLSLYILVVAVSLYASSTRADFSLNQVDAFVDSGLLQLDAKANLNLPAETQEALDSGVDLRIVFSVQLVKNRDWVWDAPLKGWEMLFTLHFHQLSGQYILATPKSDSIQAFNTAQQSLDALASQLSFNLGYDESLERYKNLYLRTRIKLDTKYLPAPLKLFSLVFSEWKLDSGWSQWDLE